MTTERKERSPEIVTLDNIEELAKLLGMEFAQKTIDPLNRVLDFIESMRGSFLMPSTPYISLREKTLYQILDSFERNMKCESYSKTLYEAGFAIGLSFADDLVSFLIQNNKCPKDENILIKIWMMLDTNAGWGRFEGGFDKGKRNFAIKVSEYFLTRGIAIRKERNLPFIEGYVYGVLWESLKLYPRMFEKILGIERQHYEPNLIEKKISEDDTITLSVDTKAEELSPAFDILFEVYTSLRDSDHDKLLLNARRALECAFRLKIGLDSSIKKDLSVIMRVFHEKNVPFNYGKAKDVYGRTSVSIHDPKKVKEAKSWEVFDDCREVIRQLATYSLPESLSREIKDAILKPTGVR